MIDVSIVTVHSLPSLSMMVMSMMVMMMMFDIDVLMIMFSGGSICAWSLSGWCRVEHE
jgi:hypothetical protein